MTSRCWKASHCTTAVPEESYRKVTGVQRPKPPSPSSLEVFLGFLLEHVLTYILLMCLSQRIYWWTVMVEILVRNNRVSTLTNKKKLQVVLWAHIPFDKESKLASFRWAKKNKYQPTRWVPSPVISRSFFTPVAHSFSAIKMRPLSSILWVTFRSTRCRKGFLSWAISGFLLHPGKIIHSQMFHAWIIYLHERWNMATFKGKCRQMSPASSIWDYIL